MIFYGHYRIHEGAFRPFITAYLLVEHGKWNKCSFLVDTGADITFLHYKSIETLGIDITQVNVKDDVGGIIYSLAGIRLRKRCHSMFVHKRKT